MPWPQAGATHYHAQLGLLDKGRPIKGLFACYVVWLAYIIYGIGLWTSTRCVGLVPCCDQDGYRAKVPQHPMNTYRYISNFNFYLGNFKKLQELKMRCNYLNKLECSWNINSRFDKAAFNFLLHFCLLKEVTFLESGVVGFFLFSQ